MGSHSIGSLGIRGCSVGNPACHPPTQGLIVEYATILTYMGLLFPCVWAIHSTLLAIPLSTCVGSPYQGVGFLFLLMWALLVLAPQAKVPKQNNNNK